ncbi:MAG: hypothetical protein QM763_01915 [Agriterribacter sp.]
MMIRHSLQMLNKRRERISINNQKSTKLFFLLKKPLKHGSYLPLKHGTSLPLKNGTKKPFFIFGGVVVFLYTGRFHRNQLNNICPSISEKLLVSGLQEGLLFTK